MYGIQSDRSYELFFHCIKENPTKEIMAIMIKKRKTDDQSMTIIIHQFYFMTFFKLSKNSLSHKTIIIQVVFIVDILVPRHPCVYTSTDANIFFIVVF